MAKDKAHEVDREDLERVEDLLELRNQVLLDALNNLNAHTSLTEDQKFAMAVTDVFVEKAQHVLTRRARMLTIGGIFVVAVTVVILVVAGWFVSQQIERPIDKEIPDNILILRLFQAVALGAFVLVGIKLLVSLGRSFFHEALSLLERRHALRFGRLYVYLMKGQVNRKDLEEAFQWNKETKTSFLDMKAEVVAETLLHKIVDALRNMGPDTVRAFRGRR